jgi:hypothetical protein
MPLLFIGSGLVLILSALKGDPAALWELVQGDFAGPNNFVYWFVSILVLGALGYVKGLENLSKVFMVLVLVGLLLKPNPNTGTAAGVDILHSLQNFINSTQGSSTQGA